MYNFGGHFFPAKWIKLGKQDVFSQNPCSIIKDFGAYIKYTWDIVQFKNLYKHPQFVHSF